MGVKTGETVTLKVNAELKYVCSKCGHMNTVYDVIKVVGSTSTILGVNLDHNYQDKAYQGMAEILAKLGSNDVAHRYTEAGFRCKCEKCNHREPWARINQPFMDVLYIIFTCTLVFSAIFLLSCFSDRNSPRILFGLITIFSGISLIAINIIKKQHTARMEALIPTLPPASLPQIRLLRKNEVPQNGYGYKTLPIEMREGSWKCARCDTWHDKQISRCYKCGTTKTDSI